MRELLLATSWAGITIGGVLGLIIVIVMFGSFVLVRQQSSAVIERLGRFNRVLDAGLHFKIPLLERARKGISLRIEQMQLEVDTKTKDNVFVKIVVAIQYQVIADHVREAYYQLSDPEEQIESYVFDVVRSKAPEMELDPLFENKDEIADAIKSKLIDEMANFGYRIVGALITDIIPDEKVRDAMNQINASKRLQEAAKYDGEAHRIKVVAEAQAFAESKKLQGEGVANERRAIAEGVRDSVKILKEEAGVDPGEAMATLVLTQQLDTLREVGSKSGATILLMPTGPAGVTDFFTEFGAMKTALAGGAIGSRDGGDSPDES